MGSAILFFRNQQAGYPFIAHASPCAEKAARCAEAAAFSQKRMMRKPGEFNRADVKKWDEVAKIPKVVAPA
jgi:hypothetical protein